MSKLLSGWSVWLMIGGTLVACQDNSPSLQAMQVYEGPRFEAENIETLYSDSAQLRMRMEAPLQQEFQSGDQDFPRGIYIEFFSPEGEKTSTLRADSAHMEKATSLYKAYGNVIVINLEKHETLKTEELFWNQREDKIYTDKFVRIETPKEILLGEGLVTNQRFSPYKIQKLRGTIAVPDEE
ncbi:LPS export ABC transporter periplasmic protein LptC [Catalinimonas alkaloidigena]|nr:LPS export ABC transporter periplasmic protein LptC [Catalinimonas alkaloidigena]